MPDAGDHFVRLARAARCAGATHESAITVSQRQPRWVPEGCAEYEKRLPRAWQFELVEVKQSPDDRRGPPQGPRGGGSARPQRAPKNAILVALDERGALSTVHPLSASSSTRRETRVVIGGADGLDPELRSAAAHCLSLSPMVMPHGLARVMFVEQLYRASTIIAGHPYHK